MQPKQQINPPSNPPNEGSSVSEPDEVFLEILKKDSKQFHKLKHKIRDITEQRRYNVDNAFTLYNLLEQIEKLVG